MTDEEYEREREAERARIKVERHADYLMRLRDRIAVTAMVALLSHSRDGAALVALNAYAYADAMLRAREGEKP